jgi:hypothetical protein
MEMLDENKVKQIIKEQFQKLIRENPMVAMPQSRIGYKH